MRTDKQLIQLVLDNFNEQFRTGLCGVLLYMYTEDILTLFEWSTLKELFDEHKPTEDYGWGYWWEPSDHRPRIEFLKNLLEKI